MVENYELSGKVFNKDSIAVSSAIVNITNTRTNESVSVETNTSGEFTFDLSNLHSGWQNNDYVVLSSNADNPKSISKPYVIKLNSSIGYTNQNIYVSLVVDKTTYSGSETDILSKSFDESVQGFRVIPSLIDATGNILPLKGIDDGSGLGKVVCSLEF